MRSEPGGRGPEELPAIVAVQATVRCVPVFDSGSQAATFQSFSPTGRNIRRSGQAKHSGAYATNSEIGQYGSYRPGAMASIGRLDAPLWLLSKFLKASCWGRKIGLRNDHGINFYT
jgi:hypothetical protein